MFLSFVCMVLLSGCGKAVKDGSLKESDGKATVDTVKTDGFTMGYCRFGSGDKTLVMLPGLSVQSVLGSADAVADAYQMFTDDYTVYLFDHRADVPDTYSVSDMTEDTAKAMSALGLDHVSIMGASYGGMAAMQMAIKHPELVDKIIVASTTADISDEEYQKTLGNWVSLAEKGDAEALYLAFAEDVYPDEVLEQSKQAFIDMSKTVTEDELKEFAIVAEGIKGFDVTEDLDKIGCPVFAVADKQDKIFDPADTERLAALMEDHKDFEMYMYDGYGHAVYDLAPDFKERMLKFLSE